MSLNEYALKIEQAALSVSTFRSLPFPIPTYPFQITDDCGGQGYHW